MTLRRRIASGVALLALTAVPGHVSAQREIVQPLPAPGERQLSDALSRLARNATDVGALLDAGEAALELNDIDAAIGFFGRANELSPGNSRTKVGLARAYTRSRRPVEALRLFAEAEAAGVANARMAEERGLAFDLVGDAASAQMLYRLALANGAGGEVTRRLALSQAISGDREGFEATLLPLLERGDVAAFRTRAFGLAILGDAREAKDIANTMLPTGLGTRMAAYLDYMPRLTKAQQAAAGNLGVFPRIASIGTDDAGIAEYSPAPPQIARAPAPAAVPSPTPTQSMSGPGDREDRQRPDNAGGAAGEERSSSPATPSEPVSQPVSAAPTRNAAAQPVPDRETPPASGLREEPVVVAQAGPAGATRSATEASSASMPLPGPPQRPQSAPEPTPEPERAFEPGPRSVADAFSGFTLEPGSTSPGSNGAVDITQIDIPRERVRPKPPPPPVHPSRHWVQVATGKDRNALKFDWRRISRKAAGKLDDKGPFVTPWGEANRLLSGPYDSAEKAREMVNELRKLDIDSFPFTSAEGEAIDTL
jgi:Flp pilus assembly protein TadD